MIVDKKEFHTKTDCLQGFVKLVTEKFTKLFDIEETGCVELLFAERLQKQEYTILSRDKTSLDLEGQEVLLFIIEPPGSQTAQIECQTETDVPIEFKFSPDDPKKMNLTCSICSEDVLVTDEYIRLLDCNHTFHRICLIHSIAEITSKRFFLTRREQKKV